MLKTTTRSLAVVAVGLSLGLGACGSKSDPAASPSAAASATASSTSVTATASASAKATASASASKKASASATPTVKATMVKDLSGITVSPTSYGGKTAPKVTAKWPIQIAKTQVKVLQQGSGPTVATGGTVEVNYHGVDARTGKVFDSSFGKQPVTFPLGQVVTGFRTALQGQKVGSRVLVMMTAADGYPQGNPQAGIAKGDNLIFVIDVVSTAYTKATGTTVAPRAGLPTVKDDAKGAPVVTIPKTAAPTSLVVQPLINGNGPRAVAATDQIVVNYRAWDYKTGKQLQDSYATGAETGVLSQLVPAWRKALVGKKDGSRLLVVAPPSEAYGNKAAGPIPANTTIVYVIDVLYSMTPQQQ